MQSIKGPGKSQNILTSPSDSDRINAEPNSIMSRVDLNKRVTVMITTKCRQHSRMIPLVVFLAGNFSLSQAHAVACPADSDPARIGPVMIEGEDFCRDGNPVRFWGTNFVFQGWRRWKEYPASAYPNPAPPA